MMSFLFGVIVATILWYILDNYTSIPEFWKWIIVFVVLMIL